MPESTTRPAKRRRTRRSSIADKDATATRAAADDRLKRPHVSTPIANPKDNKTPTPSRKRSRSRRSSKTPTKSLPSQQDDAKTPIATLSKSTASPQVLKEAPVTPENNKNAPRRSKRTPTPVRSKRRENIPPPQPLAEDDSSHTVHKVSYAEHVDKEKADTSGAPLSVYECAFLKPHVPGFTSIDVTADGNDMAVSCTDGNIEHLHHTPSGWMQTSIAYSPSAQPESGVSALRFSPCGKYLAVARLDGSLTFLKLSGEGLLEHVVLRPAATAIWDMAFAPGKGGIEFVLSLACDDGRVRFVRPDKDAVSSVGGYDASLPERSVDYLIESGQKASTRLLSIVWGAEDFVVCGDSDGGVRWISVEDGSLLGLGTIPPPTDGPPILVWSVAILSDGNTVVCGDDRGLLTVWSSRTTTMEGEVKVEGVKGAVWCAVSAVQRMSGEEVVVFGAANGGVGALRFSTPTEDQEDGVSGQLSWSSVRAKLFHTHDVRGVAALPDGSVATAAVDSRVAIVPLRALVNKDVYLKWPSFVDGVLTQGAVRVMRGLNMMVARGTDELTFWRLPKSAEMVPLFRLRMQLKSFGEALRAFAVSEDGRTVAVSSADLFRIYRVWDGVGEVGLSPSYGKVESVSIMEKAESALRGCVDVVFCGGMVLAISRCRTLVLCYDVEGRRLARWSLEQIGSSSSLLGKLSSGGGRVAVTSSRGGVFTFDLSGKRIERWRPLIDELDRGCFATAVCVSPSGKRVGFCLNGRDSRVVTLEKGETKMRGEVVCEFGGVVNSMMFSDKEKGLLISGMDMMRMFALSKVVKRKREDEVKMRKKKKYAKYFDVKFGSNLWSTGVLGLGRVVAVRKRMEAVQSSLPDAIPKKMFGS